MHEHGACQPTPSKHHSHARCVHLGATMPNEPQPNGECHQTYGSTEQGHPSTAGREKNIEHYNRGTACLVHTVPAHHAWDHCRHPPHICARERLRLTQARGVFRVPSTGNEQQGCHTMPGHSDQPSLPNRISQRM